MSSRMSAKYIYLCTYVWVVLEDWSTQSSFTTVCSLAPMFFGYILDLQSLGELLVNSPRCLCLSL